MEFSIQQKNFSGPLELLLELIANKKMDVTEISIKEVTDDFLNYIEVISEERAAVLADFLVVAARLILLKSKTLLPGITADEEGLIPLEDQLKIYKEFADASRKIEKIWNKGQVSFGGRYRGFDTIRLAIPDALMPRHLTNSFVSVIGKIFIPIKLHAISMANTISIKEKIRQIRDFINVEKGVTLKDLFKSAVNKAEVVLSFLALLELVKQKEVKLSQAVPFSDINIWRTLTK